VIGWLRRWSGGRGVPLRAARWVVVDCETTGLDPARDALVAVGAVALRAGRIEAGEGFHAVVRPAAADAGHGAAAALVHGIGAEAQLAGRAPREALEAFNAFAAGALPVAFHAAFDAAVLRRAAVQAGAPAVAAPWLDLAQLAPALNPARRARSLDEWLAVFGIPLQGRHDAMCDAFATAQLLQVLLAQAERQGVHDTRALAAVARDRRWAGGA
jgi:DNA polymerase-3 subunit epsilon